MSEDKSQAQIFGIQGEYVEAIRMSLSDSEKEAIRMSLSDSEKEVFDMVMGGLDFEEIGKKLHISPGRVRVLRTKILIRIHWKIRKLRDGADLHLQKINAPTEGAQSRYPLRGTLLFYNDPTAPVGEDDWNALK